MLRKNKEALGWTLGDIHGISPTIVQHRIHLEDNPKPYRDRQRILNPTLQEVVKKEILKWLDHDIIYSISDSKCVSPLKVIIKKTSIIVIKDEKDKLIPIRISVDCMHDYWKLDATTRKDYFPLPILIKV